MPKLTEGDAEGYELYRKMIEAMRQADSLSYVSHYVMSSEHHGRTFSMGCTYRVWLKKPNYFRVETEIPPARLDGNAIASLISKEWGGRVIGSLFDWLRSWWAGDSSPAERKKGGILVGDGENLWIYWPEGRPRWSSDASEDDEKARQTCYMTKRTPLAHTRSVTRCVTLAG